MPADVPGLAQSADDFLGNNGLLLGGRCDCSRVHFPIPAEGCDACDGPREAIQPYLLSGRGILIAAAHPDRPEAAVEVELDEGPIVAAPLADDSGDARPGQRMIATLVAITFDDGEGPVLDLRFVTER